MNLNQKILAKHVNQLYGQLDSIELAMMDLAYPRHLKNLVTDDLAENHRAILLDSFEHSNIFAPVVGYVCGPLDKGVRLFLFVEGSKVPMNFNMSDLVGNYWRNVITGGIGSFYSFNVDAYNRIPFGAFNYADDDLRANVTEALETFVTNQGVSYYFRPIDADCNISGSLGIRKELPPNVGGWQIFLQINV